MERRISLGEPNALIMTVDSPSADPYMKYVYPRRLESDPAPAAIVTKLKAASKRDVCCETPLETEVRPPNRLKVPFVTPAAVAPAERRLKIPKGELMLLRPLQFPVNVEPERMGALVDPNPAAAAKKFLAIVAAFRTDDAPCAVAVNRSGAAR